MKRTLAAGRQSMPSRLPRCGGCDATQADISSRRRQEAPGLLLGLYRFVDSKNDDSYSSAAPDDDGTARRESRK